VYVCIYVLFALFCAVVWISYPVTVKVCIQHIRECVVVPIVLAFLAELVMKAW